MRILVCLFGEIEFDGRVQRESAALAQVGQVTVFCLESHRPFASPSFGTVRVERPALRSQWLTHLKFWLALWRHARKEKPDLVHAHDFFTAFPGWLAARLAGARLVYDSHELLIPDPPANWPLAVTLVWYRLERWAIRRADLVIAANEERAALMAQHYRLRQPPLSIRNIPVLQDAARPPTPEAIGLAFDIPEGARLLVYQGDIDLMRGIDRFVAALAHLPPEYHLVVIGAGPSVQAVRELAARDGTAARLHLVGRVTRDSLYHLLRRCHVGVVTYGTTGLNMHYCASNKIYEYADAGLPMIMTDQPPLRAAAERYGIGRVVRHEHSPQEVAAAIRAVCDRHGAHAAALPRFLGENTWQGEAAKLQQAVAALGR